MTTSVQKSPSLLDRLSRPLPGWAVASLLLALSLLFMARALLAPPGETMGGFDVRSSFYAWASFAADTLRSGQFPFWNPYSFGGEPFLSNPQAALFYPPQWLVLALPLRFSFAVYLAFHIWLAGMGMYRLVKGWTGNQLGALLAAFTLMFGGFTAGRSPGRMAIRSPGAGRRCYNHWHNRPSADRLRCPAAI